MMLIITMNVWLTFVCSASLKLPGSSLESVTGEGEYAESECSTGVDVRISLRLVRRLRRLRISSITKKVPFYRQVSIYDYQMIPSLT